MKPFTKPLARTPLHHWHAVRNARFIERDGWHIAASYSDVAREVAAARAGLGLMDVSAFAQIDCQGNGVTALSHALLGDSPMAKPQGVATFEAGGRALACRLTEDHLLLLALTTDATALRDRLAMVNPTPPAVHWDMHSADAMFAILGASAEEVLRHVTALDLGPSTFPAGRCAETSLAGVHALLIRPPEWAPDIVLIAVAWNLGEYVWEQLLEAGRGHAIEPVGLDAWHSLLSAPPTTSVGR